MVFKDYKMKGYTLHTIKTDKFKMCHVEVIFRNNVVKEEITKILSSPNSTLAICYIKALISMGSKINPVAVKRVVSDHDDLSLGALSSSAIRKELFDKNYEPLKDQNLRQRRPG